MKKHFIKTAKIKWKKIQNNVFERECLARKKGLNISVLKIVPCGEISMHRHEDARYNFILKGSMSDGYQTFKKGDLVINKKGSKHFLKAGPKGCEFLLMWNK